MFETYFSKKSSFFIIKKDSRKAQDTEEHKKAQDTEEHKIGFDLCGSGQGGRTLL